MGGRVDGGGSLLVPSRRMERGQGIMRRGRLYLRSLRSDYLFPCLFSSRFSPPVLNFQEPTRLPTICPLPFVPATFPLGQRVRSRVPLSIKSFPPFYSGERLVVARTDSLRVDVFERGTVLDNIRGIDSLRWLW